MLRKSNAQFYLASFTHFINFFIFGIDFTELLVSSRYAAHQPIVHTSTNEKSDDAIHIEVALPYHVSSSI